MERLHTSLFLCLGSHKPGPDSQRKYATPTAYAKRLNICSMNPTPWSLSTKLNVFIHSDHPRKRSNASAKCCGRGTLLKLYKPRLCPTSLWCREGFRTVFFFFFQKSCLYALRHTIISELPRLRVAISATLSQIIFQR